MICSLKRYLPLYADGAKPRFIEGDMFITVAPLKAEESVGEELSPYSGEAVEDQIDRGGAPPVTPPVAPPVAPPVKSLLELLGRAGELGAAEIREQLGLKDRTHVRESYISPALNLKVIAYTIPEKPTSRLQKYRLTRKGRKIFEGGGGM